MNELDMKGMSGERRVWEGGQTASGSVKTIATKLICLGLLLSVPAAIAADDTDAKDLWSFQPVAQPDLPQTLQPEWTRTALDQFVLSRLEATGLKPNADAEPVFRPGAQGGGGGGLASLLQAPMSPNQQMLKSEDDAIQATVCRIGSATAVSSVHIYALDGRMATIGRGVILVTPHGSTLSAGERERLTALGLYEQKASG